MNMIKCAGHVTRTGMLISAYTVPFNKPDGMRDIGRLKGTQQCVIKMNMKYITMDRAELAKDSLLAGCC